MKSFIQLIKLQLIKTVFSIRFFVGLSLTLFFMLLELISLRNMADYFDLPIHVSVLSFILSDHFFLLILFLSLLLIFSNMPYRDAQQPQLILRTGRKKWLFSYFLTSWIISLIFILILLLFELLILITYLDFSNTWGKILGTLGQQPHFGQKFGIEYHYSYYIQIQLSPFDALIRTLGNSLMVMSLFGNIVIVGNLLSEKFGNIAGSCTIFLHIMSTYVLEYYFYYLSPISWISLMTTTIESVGALPSIHIILTNVLIGNSLTILILFYLASQKNKHSLL